VATRGSVPMSCHRSPRTAPIRRPVASTSTNASSTHTHCARTRIDVAAAAWRWRRSGDRRGRLRRLGGGASSYRWNIPLTTSAPLTRAAESRRRHGGRAQGPKHEEGEGESRSSRRRSPEGCRRQDVRVSGSTAPYSWPSFGQTRSSTPAVSCRWPLAAKAPSSSLCLPFPGMRAPSCR